MRILLNASYEKSDLNKVITNQCQHLSSKERNRLLTILKKFEDLFEGTLGTWNTTLLEL